MSITDSWVLMISLVLESEAELELVVEKRLLLRLSPLNKYDEIFGWILGMWFSLSTESSSWLLVTGAGWYTGGFCGWSDWLCEERRRSALCDLLGEVGLATAGMVLEQSCSERTYSCLLQIVLLVRLGKD
jgi:hypothetical protein